MQSTVHVNPFDLLGQEEIYPRPIRLPGRVQPRLDIAWDSFHQNFFTGLAVFFKPARLSKELPADNIFQDCYIKRRIPRAAMVAAVVFHVLVFMLPWSLMPVAGHTNPELANTEVTWSGPINDFPLLEIKREKAKLQPKGEANKALPAEGADAFHPRQRIYTDPSRPTHPRQTLNNPAAPADAPKFLPEMPNIVRLENTSGPARPHMEISDKTLAKLRPRMTTKTTTAALPTLDVPNVEQRTAEVSMAIQPNAPAKPKLEINAASAPRVAERKEAGDSAAAPDMATPAVSNPGNASSTFIALSATPGPVAPVAVPQGNLAARVAISPDGKTPGAPGGGKNSTSGTGGEESGSNGATAGKNSVGISITGGNPKPNTTVSGLGGSGRLIIPRSSTAAMSKRGDAGAIREDAMERSGPPNFAALPPGANPELIFSSKRVYSMNVNMPNLNSATGSWIIHFSELHLANSTGEPAHPSSELSAPEPLRKVDPKYPQDLILQHVEGQIVLYGVIRKTGKVDSIQVVRSLDPQLDANSVSAFAEWKFQPASKDGQPVDLEAIVYIPFHAPARQ